MGFITDVFEIILIWLYLIFHFLFGFFLAKASYAFIFRIAFLVLVGFLIYTAFRPAKWKWITLYTGDVLFFMGSIAALCLYAEGDLDDYLFGLYAVVYGVLLFFAILGCSLRTPADPKNKAGEDQAPALPEDQGGSYGSFN